MKDKSARDKITIEHLRQDVQRLTHDYFRFKEMLSKMYDIASKATSDDEVQMALNNIMLQDHFMRKQIPVHGNYNPREKSA